MLSEEAMVGLDKTGLFAPDSRINLATGEIWLIGWVSRYFVPSL